MGCTVTKKIAIAEIEDLANPPEDYGLKCIAAKYCHASHYSRVDPDRLEALVFLLKEIKPRLLEAGSYYRILMVQRGWASSDRGHVYTNDVYLIGPSGPWRISSKVARAFGYRMSRSRDHEYAIVTRGGRPNVKEELLRLFDAPGLASVFDDIC